MKSGSNRFKASASASHFRHCSISKNWRLSVSFLAEALDLISISLRRNFTYALFAADVRAETCSRWWRCQSRIQQSILTTRARQRRRIWSGSDVVRARSWRSRWSRRAYLLRNDYEWLIIRHKLIWRFAWRRWHFIRSCVLIECQTSQEQCSKSIVSASAEADSASALIFSESALSQT